jgi:hypothetical protein
MLRNDQPSANPIMLVALCAAVGFMVCFGSGMYWVMQPTVLPNAGLAGYEAQMRRTNVLLTAGLGHDSERLAVELADHENDRQGLRSLASKPARQEPAAPAPVAGAPPTPEPKRVATAPKRKPLEIHATRSAPPPSFGPFGAFQSLFR